MTGFLLPLILLAADPTPAAASDGAAAAPTEQPSKPVRVKGLFTPTWNRINTYDILGTFDGAFGLWKGRELEIHALAGFGGRFEFAHSFQNWLRIGLLGGFWWYTNADSARIWVTGFAFSVTFFFLYDLGLRACLGFGFSQAKDPSQVTGTGTFLFNSSLALPSVAFVYEIRIGHFQIVPEAGIHLFGNTNYHLVMPEAAVSVGFNW